MRIHHLNCSTLCPCWGNLIDGMAKGIKPGILVCHCLLVETESGLILIDTGLGSKDVHNPKERISKLFRNLLRPACPLHETALLQIRRLGFSPSDVRHIVLTHLDFDHAGGVDDFPNATVHLMRPEASAARERDRLVSQKRYSPHQLAHLGKWNSYLPVGESWMGFRAVRELNGLPPEILLVPLYGHSEGHAGVAVKVDNGWLLHAGDAYFHHREMEERPHCPPGLRAYQKFMEVDSKKRLWNQERLRQLITKESDVTVFCAHDPVEYMSLKKEAITSTVWADQYRSPGPFLNL